MLTRENEEVTQSFLTITNGKEKDIESFQPWKGEDGAGAGQDEDQDVILDSKNKGLWKQFCAAFSVCSLCISAGNFLGFTSTAIPSMKEDWAYFWRLTPYQISWIGGLSPLGAMVGCLLAILAIRKIGPKFTALFLSAPILIFSWLLIAFSKNIDMIFAGRFLGGIGSGTVLSASSIYVIEVVADEQRGKIGILPQFLLIFGIWLSTVIGTFVKWRTLALISGLMALPSIPLLLCAPQSPLYFIKRNELILARDSYHRLGHCIFNCSPSNNKNYYCKFQRLLQQRRESALQNNNSGNKSVAVKSGTRLNAATVKACAVALCLMSFQQLIGINGVTFYAVTIFKNSAGQGAASSLSYFSAIFLITVQLLAVIISTCLVDKIGRKTLLAISGFILTSSSSALGVFYYFCTRDPDEQLKTATGASALVTCDQLNWVPLGLLVLYVFAFALGYGPISWILVSEILPPKGNIRNFMNPLAIGYSWFCVFLVTTSFPLLMVEIGLTGIFFLFGGVGVVSLIFVYFCVPETKARSLAEIQRWFEGRH